MEEQSVTPSQLNVEKDKIEDVEQRHVPQADQHEAPTESEINVTKVADDDVKETEKDIADKTKIEDTNKDKDNINKSGNENTDSEIADKNSENSNNIGDDVDAKLVGDVSDAKLVGDVSDAKLVGDVSDAKQGGDDLDAKQMASNSQTDANPFSFSTSSSSNKKKSPASVPTFIDDKEYTISSSTKKLIILNQKHFASKLGLTERKGTERDEDAIVSTFKPLGWDISVHNDLNMKQVRDVIMDIQTADEGRFDALAIFILSHGEDNGTIFTYDGAYRIYNDILAPLAANKCPALAGRPKMIFVQACQGRDVDSGTDVTFVRSRSVTSHDAISTVTYKIPNYADFLIYQASFCGHYSFRNSSSGSWFIQSLCSKINESGSEEALLDVLLEVSRGIAIEKESFAPNTPQLDMKKQVPLLYSTLLRKVYLKDRGTREEKKMVGAEVNGEEEKNGKSLDETKDLNGNGTSSGSANKNKNKRKDSCVCM